MRNKIIKLLSFLVLGTTLTACKTEKKTISLNIWTYYNTNIETSFQEIITNFNNTVGANEKIVVSTTSQGSLVSDLSDALLSSAKKELGADQMPDMFLSYADTAYELNELGVLANIGDYFNSEDLKKFNSDFLSEGYFNNELKILPVSKSTEALYINKTDFDKFLNQYPNCGITYNDLSTFEGLIKVSEIYYNLTGKAFFGRDSLDNYFVVGAKQLGINILDYDESNTLQINYNRDVFKKLWDSYFVPYVKGYFNSTGKFRSSDVQAGTILAYIGSTASANYFPKKVYVSDKESYPIEPLILQAPSFKDGTKVAASQGAGFCITSSSKEREEACAKFLKWLTEYDNITAFSKASGYFPATTTGFDNNFVLNQTDSILKSNFEICKQTIESSTMYTNIVGLNGSTHRNYLKESFTNALENAKETLKNSTDKEQTIQTLTSEEYFNTWFTNLGSRARELR